MAGERSNQKKQLKTRAPLQTKPLVVVKHKINEEARVDELKRILSVVSFDGRVVLEINKET